MHYSKSTFLFCPLIKANLFQEYTNLFFVCLFTCEMALKMYALGLSGYMVSLFNRYHHLAFFRI